MPTPKKGPRFGGTSAHHEHIMSNLATELFRHGRIRTTKAKAKTVQPLAERMITFAKRGDLHSRRRVLQVIRDKDVVHKLFADIAPAVAGRDGGYTRVTKLGPRKGDNAEMALIELVDTLGGDGDRDLTEEPRRRWSLRRRRGTLSRTARDREEARAAEQDAGLQGVGPPEVEPEPEPSAPERISEQTLDRGDTDEGDEDSPTVRPEDVEARLAAEDKAAADTDADEDAVPDVDAADREGSEVDDDAEDDPKA